MDRYEDRGEADPLSKTDLCGEPESQSKCQRIHQGEKPEEEPGPESFSSNESMFQNIEFTSSHTAAARRDDGQKLDVPIVQPEQQDQAQLDSIFMTLEDNIVSFVRNELKIIQRFLSSDDCPKLAEGQREDENVLEGDEEQERSSRKAFVKITVHFLRRMKQEQLAVRLQSSKIMFHEDLTR